MQIKPARHISRRPGPGMHLDARLFKQRDQKNSRGSLRPSTPDLERILSTIQFITSTIISRG